MDQLYFDPQGSSHLYWEWDDLNPFFIGDIIYEDIDLCLARLHQLGLVESVELSVRIFIDEWRSSSFSYDSMISS